MNTPNSATKSKAPEQEREGHSSPDTRGDIFKNLCGWISRSAGGEVHSSLSLQGEGSARGVVAIKDIPKGEILISLPAKLAVSGSQQPKSYGGITVSNWLRCIAAYYEARQRGVHFLPYLKSLPAAYESLLDWSDEEIDLFLSGTRLGSLVQKDRASSVMESRFQEAVRPYLEHLSLVPPSQSSSIQEELDVFREACMCVATRGFHLDNVSTSDDANAAYSGPFLLPFIDLLNHEPSHKCTTLKWGSIKGCFYMEAERDICATEEIYHSYGSSLTSAQVLKTFGFVPQISMSAATRPLTTGVQVTAAMIEKHEIVAACIAVSKSSFPARVRFQMEVSNMTEENEHWDLSLNLLGRNLSSLPDDFAISCQDPLSDELITACSTLLLPPDAYNELQQSGSPLLDKTLLQDYFLGKLVCQAIYFAISEKLKVYLPMKRTGTSTTEDDKALLKSLNGKPGCERKACGLTIRLEEKACLLALSSEIFSISDSLGGAALMTKIIDPVTGADEMNKLEGIEPADKKQKFES